jgi:hypothetical protein
MNFIYVLGVLAFLLQTQTFYGEDIVNARNNYLTGTKTDFWGGMSTLVYAHIPSIGVRWQIWLALFQLSITTIGLSKLISLKNLTKSSLSIRVLLVYSSLVFGSQMTRDGLMFSFLTLGFALLKEVFYSNWRPSKFILPLILIISGMTFRPWLSVAILPFVLLLSRGSKKAFSRASGILALIAISVVPVASEIAISKVLKLAKSYPEQQVMIMDTAASYCYSNNASTGIRAMSALQLFSSNPNYSKTACQLFRPDTWISLTKGGNTSSEGIKSDFGLIKVGDSTKYEKAKSLWLEMIIKDPVTYIQNKIIFAGKLFIGSDSRNLSFLNENNLTMKLLALFRLPYDLAITFHLYSLIAAGFYLFLGSILQCRRSKAGSLVISVETLLLVSSLMIWLGLSSIAYIGSNGRYTYTVTLLALILFVSNQHKEKKAAGQ